jgi:hypothetical protein
VFLDLDLCSLVPLKTTVVISVGSEFDDALPSGFLMFQIKLDSLRLVQNGRVAEPRGRRCRWSHAAVISVSNSWEHGASLAVWLVLAHVRSVVIGAVIVPPCPFRVASAQYLTLRCCVCVGF